MCLLQAGLVHRAIKLHVRLHNWQRALDLARKHQQHVDTVLMYRRRCVGTAVEAM
jgi:intraflagellar transport protein 80